MNSYYVFNMYKEGKEHRIAPGTSFGGARESEAVLMYRALANPEAIAAIYQPIFDEPQRLAEEVQRFNAFLDHCGEPSGSFEHKRVPFLQQMRLKHPDVVSLYRVLLSMRGERMVHVYSDIFAMMVRAPQGTEPQTLLQKNGMHKDFHEGPMNAATLALLAAYTEPSSRSTIPRDGWITFRDHQYYQILELSPDLTKIPELTERTNASIDLVGTQLPHILAHYDSATRTTHNAYRHKDEAGRLPQRTDRGVCPAQRLSQAWLEGIGMVLRNNQLVLEEIVSHER